MAKLQATLRALAPTFPALDELGARLNEILHRDGLDNRYATLFYLEIAPGAGGVRYLNAGHNRPYLVRAATVEPVSSSSLPLGLLPRSEFAENRIEMEPGDLLVVYSDGLTEARDENEREFGTERLEALLPGLRGLAPERAGERILGAFHRFVGSAPRHDDLSLLLVEREG
jgi:sigma-B regulation protein RsbU (phosphoserine phosphatase)